MIKITSLNKVYRSKKRKHCHALKDINLTLPDSGLVFVLGKSGSGKSTLLNLIGGLDNLTSGSIEVDGNDLARFREKDFCNYRNTHIGFIFQDYHLIDELTVYENIVLSLNLRRLEDKNDVKNALARVDLAGYEDRYPSELSGGEQQRVAIARAIVKKPRIILADEPTGNLDTNTAKAIVELLKELSKECLILIVSHNVNDANSYADRIIELKKGEIISDVTRNPEFPNEIVLQDDTLFYPENTSLTEKDVALINENKSANIVIKKDKFLSTKEQKKEAKRLRIENKNLSFGKETLLSGKFLKNKMFAIAASSFMVAAIMVIMALAQTIIAFDSSRIIAGEMLKSNQTSLLLNKKLDEETAAILESRPLKELENGDIQSFINAGYNGDIYPVYNITLPTVSAYKFFGYNTSTFSQNLCLNDTLGLIVVDEDFLTKKFDGLSFHVKRAEPHPLGVYITDYVADSILTRNSSYKGKDYKFLVQCGYSLSSWSYDTFIINGIIDTGYKEKYKELLSEAASSKFNYYTSMDDNADLRAFMTDIYEKLGYTFSLNPNYIEEYVTTEDWKYPTYHTLVVNGKLPLNYKNAYITQYKDHGDISLTNNSYRYTNLIPEIPDGAKYIRVAYMPDYERYVMGVDESSLKGYANLRFDNNEPISEDLMNYKQGCLLKANGSINEGATSSVYWISDYISIPENSVITDFSAITYHSNYSFYAFYDGEKNIISAENPNKYPLNGEKSILMPYKVYNTLFNTDYATSTLDKFVPHTISLAHYKNTDVKFKEPLFKEKVTIAGLTDEGQIKLSEDLFSLIYKDSVFPFALYLDGTDNIGAALDMAEELNFEAQSVTVEGIHTMTKVIDVFVPIFEIIAIFLCAAAVFILVNFSTKMIQDKMHEIGILKALGTKNSTIGAIFGLQVVLIAILTCVLSTVGYYYIVGVANDVLFESMKRFAEGNVVLDLEFFTFMPDIAIDDCALIILLAIVSMLIPLIRIKAIKPVKIIKAKE
ncbi:MAG: ABC transporter ATP-binding protein/permease [Clostridia bacterium]|nr:ABC transporter ATP-binding protein/permease [Clostridia bacterium]